MGWIHLADNISQLLSPFQGCSLVIALPRARSTWAVLLNRFGVVRKSSAGVASWVFDIPLDFVNLHTHRHPHVDAHAKTLRFCFSARDLVGVLGR